MFETLEQLDTSGKVAVMALNIGDYRQAGEDGPAGDPRAAGDEGPAGDPRPAGAEAMPTAKRGRPKGADATPAQGDKAEG